MDMSSRVLPIPAGINIPRNGRDCEYRQAEDLLNMRNRPAVKHVAQGLLFLCIALLPSWVLPSAALVAGDQFAYTQVYEPQTSLPLAATVVWQADANTLAVAREAVRPASAAVYLDASLRVLARGGQEIAPELSEYLDSTATSMIPVLHPLDEGAADALLKMLRESGRKDLFVAVSGKNASWLTRFTSLMHIRGLVDFTANEISGEDALEEIIRVTNSSGAKVAILPREAATRANVRFLQSRLITVWAESGSNEAALIGTLTSGVNGLVVTDYQAAYRAIGFFADDAPSMLRVPFIAGHRGMPSEYAENTLMSAQGAFSAGADIIENDIWLSRDGRLFINHDKSLKRLFNREDISDSERLTLAELQEIPFSFEGMSGVPESNNQPAKKSRNGFIRQDPSLRIPALDEYYEAFRGTDIVHFVEIKSHNPAIVPALKALSEEMGTAGQTVVITFNTVILEAMKQEWPEMSLGALGTEGSNLGDGRLNFPDYAAIIRREGAEKALELLYRVLQPWNATYNPKFSFTYELARVGRHRGLTVWPWTYNDPKVFADAWLSGIYGLTTNFAWWASDFVTEITGKDERLSLGAALPRPLLTTRNGVILETGDARAITLSGTAIRDGIAVSAGESLLLWRVKQNLMIQGKDYGAYYLYSEPFRVLVE